jgi:hypothetical protein
MTSDETTMTQAEEIARTQYQAEEEDADRAADIERARARDEERERTKRKYALQNKIEAQQRLLEALLEHLSTPDLPPDELLVTARMIQRAYTEARNLIPAFIAQGGGMYTVDRGLFRKLFDVDD